MGRGVGVYHVAYTWHGIDEFRLVVQTAQGGGIVLVRPVRHGMTLSMSHADPDGNLMESQIEPIVDQGSTQAGVCCLASASRSARKPLKPLVSCRSSIGPKKRANGPPLGSYS